MQLLTIRIAGPVLIQRRCQRRWTDLRISLVYALLKRLNFYAIYQPSLSTTYRGDRDLNVGCIRGRSETHTSKEALEFRVCITDRSLDRRSDAVPEWGWLTRRVDCTVRVAVLRSECLWGRLPSKAVCHVHDVYVLTKRCSLCRQQRLGRWNLAKNRNKGSPRRCCLLLLCLILRTAELNNVVINIGQPKIRTEGPKIVLDWPHNGTRFCLLDDCIFISQRSAWFRDMKR